MRIDQSAAILRLRVQLLQEQAGSAELVLVRRILEQFERLLVRQLHLVGTVAEREMAQRLDGRNVGRVVEAPLIGRRLRDDDVRRVPAPASWPRLASSGSTSSKAAAQHDGVADGERLERAGEQHAAVNLGLDVEIVGDFEIVDHRGSRTLSTSPEAPADRPLQGGRGRLSSA